jgi:8-oxo-dGTP pyrophosphatase MutT (NUDIX family)
VSEPLIPIDLADHVIVENREVIYEGFISLETADITRESTKKKSALLARPSVHVVALTEDQRVIMTRQFRYPVWLDLLEIPAGGIDEGEAPEEAAVRELYEETGYSASKIDFLGGFITSPGSSNERSYFYLARELSFDKNAPRLAEEADLVVETPLLSEALYAYLDSPSTEPRDGKTAFGLLLAAKKIGSTRSQQGEILPSKAPTDVELISKRIIVENGEASLEEARVIMEAGERNFLAFRPRNVIEVLPLDASDQVSYIYHYRWPVKETLGEFPAGGIEEGETPETALHRELREEVGMGAGRVSWFGSYYFSPGTMDSYVVLALAEDCKSLTDNREESLLLASSSLESLREKLQYQNKEGCLYTRLLLELVLRARASS